MEKVLWVRSQTSSLGKRKEDDGLEEVNQYLSNGWTVKHIAAPPSGDSLFGGQAYVVIEKKNE